MRNYLGTFLALILTITLVIAAGIGLQRYFASFSETQQINPGTSGSTQSGTTPPISTQPTITISIESDQSILMRWENLPDGTMQLFIFRRKASGGIWEKWRAVDIQNYGLSGSASIALAEGEHAADFNYYGEAIGNSGVTLWTSEETNTGPTPPGTTPGSNPPSGTQSPQSQSPSPSPTSPLPPTPSPTPPPSQPTPPPSPGTTPPPPASFPPPTPPVAYYPSGAVASPGDGTEPFWVLHVDQRIELGWQQLPSGTTKALVRRATSSFGPWSILLQQNAPVADPYFIRIVDNTLHEPHYYELHAFSGETTLATYGPLLLEAL